MSKCWFCNRQASIVFYIFNVCNKHLIEQVNFGLEIPYYHDPSYQDELERRMFNE